MIRHYVGARYVPKFADPVAWTRGTSYEAMTIVTYNNSSYTSKIPVPATVGDPADNPDYWALTGNYNAQVEQYRQEAEKTGEDLAKETQDRISADNTIRSNLNAEIANREHADITITQNQQIMQENISAINKFNAQSNTIKNRKFLLIGDSYLRGKYSWSTTEIISWGPRLASILGLTSDQYVISAMGGTGFVAKAAGTNINFEYLLVNAPVTNKDEITDIIVAGGYNDGGTNTVSAIGSFVNKAKELYKNAQIWIGYLAGKINGYIHLNVGYNYYKIGATQHNANWLGDLYLCLINSTTGSISVFSDPGTVGGDFHPNNNGQELLAEAIAQKIKGGEYNLYIKNTATVTADNGSGSFNFVQYVYNNQLFMYLFVLDASIQFHYSRYITLSRNETVLGTVSESLVTETPYITVPIVVQTSGNNTFINVNAQLRIHNGKLMCAIKFITDNKWTTISNIVTVQFSNMTAAMPLSLVYEL